MPRKNTVAKDPAGMEDEIWRLREALPRARQSGALDMRRLAVQAFSKFASQETYRDEDVIAALSNLTLPED